MIYLDNHRATRASSKVLEKLGSDHLWISPAAPYFSDQKIIQEVESALSNLYDLTGANGDYDFLVTGGEDECARAVFAKVYLEKVVKEGKNFFFCSSN